MTVKDAVRLTALNTIVKTINELADKEIDMNSETLLDYTLCELSNDMNKDVRIETKKMIKRIINVL